MMGKQLMMHTQKDKEERIEGRGWYKQLQAGKALITWPTGKSIKVHNEAAAEMWHALWHALG